MSRRKRSASNRKPNQAQLDNHAAQLDKSTEKFWKSRGYPGRPENWETLEPESKHPPKQDE